MKGSPKPPAGEAQHVGQPGVDFRVDLPSEAAIVALAERQHGVVTLAQLMLFGLGKAAIAKPAKDGRLYRVHRGVYAAGRPHLTEHGKWMAAALAYRPRAVSSHRSAAGLLGIRRDNRAKADVTLPGRRRGARLLRVVLADYEEPTITRRELEERFLALCRTASLPRGLMWVQRPS